MTATASRPAGTTIGQYLIDRLHALGVEHVFGIPGDYVLGLYKMLEASPIRAGGHDPRGLAPGSPPTPTPGCTGWGASASPTASAG